MNNFSKRELILIVILMNLLGYYLLFNIVGIPIFNFINEKKLYIEQLQAQEEIQKIENIKVQADLASFKNIINEIESLYNQLFSITNPENIHYFINNIANSTNIHISSIHIQEELENDIDDIQEDLKENDEFLKNRVKIYNINLELLGTYENKMKFLKKIESLEKAIAITGINFSNLGNNYNSKLNLKLYSIEKELEDTEFELK